MKKILLVLIFISAMVTNVCYAEDVYIVTEGGFTKYLHTESVRAKVMSKSEQDSLFEMTYTVISIPDKDALAKLRSVTFDNKISFEKQTFTFKCSFNKNTNQWNPDGSIWIISDELWGILRKKSSMSRMAICRAEPIMEKRLKPYLTEVS